MKILLISILILTNCLPPLYNESTASYSDEAVISLKVSVFVTYNENPLEGVNVLISQAGKEIGKGITDTTGSVDIMFDQISPDNKFIDIKANKKGFQEFILKGSLLSTVTKFEIPMTKLTGEMKDSKTLHFEMNEEKIKNKK